MRSGELLRLVWTNLTQNKFKVIMTSVGIIVGAATIVMVIAIGIGGQMDVAEQFKNLNAGAIDISYEGNGSNMGQFEQRGGESSGNDFGGGPMPGGGSGPQGTFGSDMGADFFSGGMQMPDMGAFGGFGQSDRINQEAVTLSLDDVDDLETFVPDITSVSISYSTKQEVDGGELEEAASYTVAGVQSGFRDISNLSMAIGDFLTDANDENMEKVCVLGATAAKEIFGSAYEAYDGEIYIDNRPYVVNGVIEEVGTVSSGISPDEGIFIPYNTGVKYITGSSISPTITVIASNVDEISTVITNIETVLAESYPNTEFTISDAGSKMEAAAESNNILTMLLIAMAAIVFVVGGIGIMNVLFVTVKERTKEIGILKSMGCSKKDILLEFLMESSVISIIGGFLGVGFSFLVTPIVEHFSVRVELSLWGAVLAVIFAVITGTLFGFYPALKASRLIPIEALSEE